MILDKKILIGLNSRNKKHLISKGYNVKDLSEIIIDVNDLSRGSKMKINVRCDICGKEKILPYREYMNSYENGNLYSCSSKCSKQKRESTMIDRYGVKNISYLDETKEKISKANRNKSHTERLEILQKRILTNNEKYGVDHPIQNDDLYNKSKETLFKNYGVLYPTKSEYIRETINKNNIDKYGCHPSNLDYVKEKVLKTKLDKYGLDYNFFPTKTSKGEQEISDFINYLGIEHLRNDRKVLNNKELDIYIPDYNLAIEFNGIYWHSELHKDKNYHLDKTMECKENRIHLLHVFEDDWKYKKDIIKSIIRNRLGKIQNKIYARQCVIKEVKPNIVREFLDKNHIQGFCKSTYKLGLYFKGELVSLMTFGSRKLNKTKEFELIRFCNKLNTNVVGSSSKLFKYFIKNYDISAVTNIISYADISLFDGKLYEILNFNKVHLSKPNYFWIVNGIKENRWKYTKHNLIKEGYDKNSTEIDIMHSLGYYRIYGCGQIRYEYKLKK